MERKSRTPTWLVACFLVCLCTLFALAPRDWNWNHPWRDQIRGQIAQLFGEEFLQRHEFLRKWLPATPQTSEPVVVASSHDEEEPDKDGVASNSYDESASLRPRVEEMEPPIGNRVNIDEPEEVAPLAEVAVRPTMPRDVIPPIEEIPVIDESLSDAMDALDDEPSLSPQELTVANSWPLPTQLIKCVQSLCDIPECMDWVHEVIAQLDQLADCPTLADAQAAEILNQLGRLRDEAETLSRTNTYSEARGRILQVKYALDRRTAIWTRIHEIATRGDLVSSPARRPEAVIRNLREALVDLDQLDNRSEWQNYLLVQSMKDAFENERSRERQQVLARELLRRLDSPILTNMQRSFFDSDHFVRLRSELKLWSTREIHYPTLLAAIEKYESQPDPKLAETIAHDCEYLTWSNDGLAQQLGQEIELHYRNANVRVAASEKFLGRFLPEPQSFTEPVDDVISGAEVRGTSRTVNRLGLKLLPDGHRIRLGLEAYGKIFSDTGAYKGPVVFWNEGRARYEARKLIMVDRLGVKVRRAEAAADSQTYTRGMKTDFDGLFIIEDIVRSIAKSEHREKAAAAKREVERKVARKAQDRFDEEVHAQLIKAEQQFQEKVVEPLQRLQLNPVAVSMRTTDERVIARFRLAGYSQLGAHTARPRATSDSYLSIQFHQSGFNNVVRQLQFDGQMFDLRDLADQLIETFGLEDNVSADELPDDIVVEFAESDAVRFDFDEGRVAITVRLRTLVAGRHFRWRNFTVRAHYVPEIDGLDVRLVRDPDGYIELQGGGRLRMRDQVALRGIFSKVFTPSRSFPIMPQTITENPKLRDLHVSQFVINEGWIGVALAPQTRTRFVERPDMN